MSESPFNFARDLQNLGMPTRQELETTRLREEDEGRQQEEYRRWVQELDGYWDKVDKRKIVAAQRAIRSIPQDTIDFLRTRNVQYNINRRFDRGETRLGRSVLTHTSFWGYLTREAITYEKQLPRDGLTMTVATGKYRLSGYGITGNGTEYLIGGPEKTPYLKVQAKPSVFSSEFARADITDISLDLKRAILLADSAGEAGLDNYLAKEYDRAKITYQEIAQQALRGVELG
jgi:hypothetical protein